MKRGPELIDAALEGLIAPSFTRIGFEARQRLFDWRSLDSYDLSGQVIAITGATSGLGRAAAERLASDGATVIVVGRNADRSELVAREIRELTGNPAVSVVVADMGDLEAVRRAADQILRAHDRLDVLIHNAGALSAERAESPDGIEMTVATQVVGPFLMTSVLLDRLAESGQGRVLTMSSGGMYSAELTVDRLPMGPHAYNGTKQYARAKRAQVTLSEMWAQRVDAGSVVFHALHPGWADTPGVRSSLPTFHRILGPLLRDVDAGADTMVWLAADSGDPLASTGGFWLDRRVRSIHRLPSTRRSDTRARRAKLWDWVSERAGVTVRAPR